MSADHAIHGDPIAPFFDGSQPCAQTDPELFFPDHGGDAMVAKRLCATCNWRAQCLDYALSATVADAAVVGIWGGTTARERSRIRARAATPSNARADRDERILALHGEGLTNRQICDRLRVPIYTVYHVLSRNGLRSVREEVQPRVDRPKRRPAA